MLLYEGSQVQKVPNQKVQREVEIFIHVYYVRVTDTK